MILKQEHYFTKRIAIDAGVMAFIEDELGRLGLPFRHGSVTTQGGEFSLRGGGDLKNLSNDHLAQSTSLSLWFGSGDLECLVSLDRLPAGSDRPFDSTPSYIESAATSEELAFRIRGLIELLQVRFLDGVPPSPDRFTIAIEQDVPFWKEQNGALGLEPNQETRKIEAKKPMKPLPWITALLTLVAVVAYFWQGSSGERQAKTGEKTYALEGGALFRAERLVSDDGLEALKQRLREGYSPFDYKIQNVGKTAATSVRLRCGRSEDFVPRADLGTIAAGGEHEMHAKMLRGDELHKADSLCTDIIYLSYDDALGHHVIFFDQAGNAVSAPTDKD